MKGTNPITPQEPRDPGSLSQKTQETQAAYPKRPRDPGSLSQEFQTAHPTNAEVPKAAEYQTTHTLRLVGPPCAAAA